MESPGKTDIDLVLVPIYIGSCELKLFMTAEIVIKPALPYDHFMGL
jgi:hypothetical protein